MARTELTINASAERIFEVLSDPDTYAYWVVGSKKIRSSDPDWPRPGSRFYHKVGVGPITIHDHSEVEKATPPTFLQLKVKARPLGTARVKMEIEELGPDESRVTMIEDAADPLTAVVFNPLTHLIMRGRNKESLARLAALAEGRGRPKPALASA
jgi:uncharacterized protein YndB with AHSA1/START domain